MVVSSLLEVANLHDSTISYQISDSSNHISRESRQCLSLMGISIILGLSKISYLLSDFLLFTDLLSPLR